MLGQRTATDPERSGKTQLTLSARAEAAYDLGALVFFTLLGHLGKFWNRLPLPMQAVRQRLSELESPVPGLLEFEKVWAFWASGSALAL